MAGRYRFTPAPGEQSTVYRFDTAASTDTPAALWGPLSDVVLRAGGYFKADPLGALPQFRADQSVLWRKPMLAGVAVHADAVQVVGVDRAPDASEAFGGGVSMGQVVDVVDTAIAGLPATYATHAQASGAAAGLAIVFGGN